MGNLAFSDVVEKLEEEKTIKVWSAWIDVNTGKHWYRDENTTNLVQEALAKNADCSL
jgi:hypothetical protein